MPSLAHKCKTIKVLIAHIRIICMFLSNYRVSTKSKAPSPPGLKKLDSPGFSQWYPGNPHLTMDQKENLIDKDLSLVVVLPDGEEKTTTVHGRYSLDQRFSTFFNLRLTCNG